MTSRNITARAAESISTTRRALIAALPAASVVGIIPAAAQTPDALAREISPEERTAAFESGMQSAMLWVARAWIDRWQALGGDFGLRYNPAGQPEGIMRGMTCALDYWARTDRDRADLPPHTWLVEDQHHDGAVKALEGMLELLPELAEAVREIAGRQCFSRWASDREGA